jgi:PAS domain-containing protein
VFLSVDPAAAFLFGLSSGMVVGLLLDRFIFPIVVRGESYIMRRRVRR